MNNVLNKIKLGFYKSSLALGMAATAIHSNSLMVFATDEKKATTIESEAKRISNGIYGVIAGSTLFIGACLAAICFFMIMFSKDEKKVGSAISWLKRIAFCTGAILLLSTIVAGFQTIIGTSGSGLSLFK